MDARLLHKPRLSLVPLEIIVRFPMEGQMDLERFTGERHARKRAMPERMDVGQIVVRKPNRAYVRHLAVRMRKAMREHGMEFSHGWDGDKYAIRRDK